MERKSDLLVVASTHVASPTTPTASTLRPASVPFEPPGAERAAARLRSPSANPLAWTATLYPLPSLTSSLPAALTPACLLARRPATLYTPSATVPRKLERAPPFDPADSHPPRPSATHLSVDLTPSPMASRFPPSRRLLATPSPFHPAVLLLPNHLADIYPLSLFPPRTLRHSSCSLTPCFPAGNTPFPRADASSPFLYVSRACYFYYDNS